MEVYDQSKLEGERAAVYYARQGMNIVVVRPGWVYGPGDRRTFKLVRAIARKRFILVAGGKAWQTPVFIDDLIRGVLLCRERGRSGEIYHLAGSEVLTVREMAQTIADALAVSLPRLSLPAFPLKIAAWKMSTLYGLFGKEAPLTPGKLAFFIHPKPLAIAKAQDELDYNPQVTFCRGMSQAVDWYRRHKWL
jgi:dihydroflavonol-4-reductase